MSPNKQKTEGEKMNKRIGFSYITVIIAIVALVILTACNAYTTATNTPAPTPTTPVPTNTTPAPTTTTPPPTTTLPTTTTPPTTITPPPTTITPPTTTTPVPASVTINLVAQNMAFDKNTITVSAGALVTINFDNRDSVSHNFALYTNSNASTSIFVGQIIGRGTITYTFTAPTTPGNYFFRCDVHPTIMTGTFVVQ